MREEIKFKYVCVRHNGYVFSETFTIQQIEQGQAQRWLVNNIISDKELHRLRFTGLKDKSGKEIYEDDIVDWKGVIAVVNYHDQSCAFQMNWKKEKEGKTIHYYEWLMATYGDAYGVMADHIEIIGNTYSNPELLTRKEENDNNR